MMNNLWNSYDCNRQTGSEVNVAREIPMSKLTRVWKYHVEPMLDGILRRRNLQLVPRCVVSLDTSSAGIGS